MLNQKEGTYQAIETVLAEAGKTIEHGEKVQLTDAEKEKVIETVANGFFDGQIIMKPESFKKHAASRQAMRAYVAGLVKNWLAKDKRLNGGVEHTIKNPGSRAGVGDQVLKELKKLKATLTNPDQIAYVDAEIDKRKAELQAEKDLGLEINPDLIPENLRHLITG